MTHAEHIVYWLKSAEHDLVSAETLFEHQRYDWCLFKGTPAMAIAVDTGLRIL